MQKSDGGWGLLTPQDTQLLEDRYRCCHKPFQRQRETTAGSLPHTVPREEGDVVREDSGVQGELCELLLQIVAGLWTTS